MAATSRLRTLLEVTSTFWDAGDLDAGRLDGASSMSSPPGSSGRGNRPDHEPPHSSSAESASPLSASPSASETGKGMQATPAILEVRHSAMLLWWRLQCRKSARAYVEVESQCQRPLLDDAGDNAAGAECGVAQPPCPGLLCSDCCSRLHHLSVCCRLLPGQARQGATFCDAHAKADIASAQEVCRHKAHLSSAVEDVAAPCCACRAL